MNLEVTPMSVLEIPLFDFNKTTIARVKEPPTLRQAEVGDKPLVNAEGETYGYLRVLTAEHGDKRYYWNPRSIPEINEAKEFFDEAVTEGLVPHRVGVGGKPGEIMDEFDPTAGGVVFVPIKAMVGG